MFVKTLNLVCDRCESSEITVNGGDATPGRLTREAGKSGWVMREDVHLCPGCFDQMMSGIRTAAKTPPAVGAVADPPKQ